MFLVQCKVGYEMLMFTDDSFTNKTVACAVMTNMSLVTGEACRASPDYECCQQGTSAGSAPQTPDRHHFAGQADHDGVTSEHILQHERGAERSVWPLGVMVLALCCMALLRRMMGCIPSTYATSHATAMTCTASCQQAPCHPCTYQAQSGSREALTCCGQQGMVARTCISSPCLAEPHMFGSLFLSGSVSTHPCLGGPGQDRSL